MTLTTSFKQLAFRHETIVFTLLIALLIVAGFVNPDFLNLRGQLLLSRHLWEFAILALGMTLIIITGGIDLSVGSAMGMCAVAFGLCYTHTQSIPLSAVACLATGFAGGALNGLLVAKVKVHPLIVTLATYAAFRGLAEGLSQGDSYSRFGDAFASFARAMWFGVPVPAYLFAVLAIAFALFLAFTPTGRFIYAIGLNEKAARYSGIAVDAIKFWLYAASGLLAALATLVYVSRFDTAKADAGTGFELDVITAVVVGGASIYGGRGNILGTLIGLLLIHETRLFVSRQWQTDELRSIIIGCLLIVSVLVYRLFRARGRHEN